MLLLLGGEAIAGGIEDPGVVVGALHAGEETQGFTGQFAGGERAGVREGAVGLSLDVTLFLPLLEVSEGVEFGRVLHPLDDLEHGDEEDIVAAEHFFDELDQFFAVFLLGLEPRGVEVEAERGTVGIVVTVEVVTQETSELFTGLDVGAGVDHVATGQGFVEGRIVTAIEFVHDHFPDRVATGRAIVGVTVALVGHAEVQGVRPDRDTSQRSGDRGIVHEELIGHHLELLVTSDAQVRGTNSNDRSVRNVRETLDDQPSSGHLSQPIVISSLGPIVRIILVRQ